MCSECVVAEAETLHYPRSKVLNHHIAYQDEFSRNIDAPGVGKIERHIQLADVLLDEIRRQRIESRLTKSCEIALRWLNLDDLSPQVAQHSCCVWSGQYAGEIQHANAVERASHRLTNSDERRACVTPAMHTTKYQSSLLVHQTSLDWSDSVQPTQGSPRRACPR